MNIVRLDDHQPARDRGEDRTEALLESLRMHDQMISCVNFVIEEATRRYPTSAELEPLYASLELVSGKRRDIADELARLGGAPGRS